MNRATSREAVPAVVWSPGLPGALRPPSIPTPVLRERQPSVVRLDGVAAPKRLVNPRGDRCRILAPVVDLGETALHVVVEPRRDRVGAVVRRARPWIRGQQD